jgi:hypothetical protein
LQKDGLNTKHIMFDSYIRNKVQKIAKEEKGNARNKKTRI